MPLNQVATLNLNTPARFEPQYAQRLSELIERAAQGGAKVVVLPENVYAMPKSAAELIELGFSMDSPQLDWFAQQARRNQVWLIAGTLPIKNAQDPKRLNARSVVFDAQGEVAAYYDKIHLFDVVVPQTGLIYRESEQFVAGNKPVVVDTPVGRLGLSVCFDLRFPELYRSLSDLGASWFSVPAAFTQTTGQAHWHCLLKARAVENQAYVVAAAQVGIHADGRATYGHAQIIDPWGDHLTDCGAEPDCVAMAGFDDDWQQRLQRDFPVLDARRLHQKFLID